MRVIPLLALLLLAEPTIAQAIPKPPPTTPAQSAPTDVDRMKAELLTLEQQKKALEAKQAQLELSIIAMKNLQQQQAASHQDTAEVSNTLRKMIESKNETVTAIQKIVAQKTEVQNRIMRASQQRG